MSHDEVLKGNDERQGRSYGWLLIVGAALVAAVISLLSHHSSSTATPLPRPTPRPPASLRPLPTPSAAPTPSGLPSADYHPPTALVPQGGLVDDVETCPAVTKGRTLVVSFVVRNITVLPMTIVDAEPELPVGGLRPAGVTIRGGTCKHPTGRTVPVVEHPVKPGGTFLMDMKFSLDATCPAPFPVNAMFTIDVDNRRLPGVFTIYSDAGSIPNFTCRSAEAG